MTSEESIHLSCIRARVVNGAAPLVYSDGENMILEVCEPKRECGFKAKIALRFSSIDAMQVFLESALEDMQRACSLYGYVKGDA